jgi:hypothetical protein
MSKRSRRQGGFNKWFLATGSRNSTPSGAGPHVLSMEAPPVVRDDEVPICDGCGERGHRVATCDSIAGDLRRRGWTIASVAKRRAVDEATVIRELHRLRAVEEARRRR